MLAIHPIDTALLMSAILMPPVYGKCIQYECLVNTLINGYQAFNGLSVPLSINAYHTLCLANKIYSMHCIACIVCSIAYNM